MAKIKHTKTELKAQREALKRYERFLPMLQLKKQQLQVEIQTITAQVEHVQEQYNTAQAELNAWVELLAEPIDIESLVVVDDVDISEGNIAGVTIPILEGVTMRPAEVDLFDTPTWVDDAMEDLGSMVRLRVERETLEEQRDCVIEELRVTSQRVNLFEKVKIPECKEHIRVIKIFLGDEQTAAVARGKLAKKRTDGSDEDAA